jgi:hypothetical protein
LETLNASIMKKLINYKSVILSGLLSASIGFMACASETEKAERVTKKEQADETSTPVVEDKMAADVPAEDDVDMSAYPEQAKPKMVFEKTEYQFGEITQGDKVNHVFKFTNEGDAPLKIDNARASCGCTVPEWPKDPILPGETGEIKVVFNSAGKSGMQNKSITITTNQGDQPARVYLKGNVKLPSQN